MSATRYERLGGRLHSQSLKIVNDRGGQHSSNDRASSLGFLIVLVCASVSLRLLAFMIPAYENMFAVFIFYSTFVHEQFHCFSSYLVGGQCVKFTIFNNLSGVAQVSTSWGATGLGIISAVGLLAPAAVGTLLMVFGVKPQLRFYCWLFLLALMLVSLPFLEGVFAITTVLALCVVMLLLGLYGSMARYYLVAVLGTQLQLAVFDNWAYLFSSRFSFNGQVMISDSQYIANAFYPHSYLFWGGLIASFSLILFVYSIVKVVRYIEHQGGHYSEPSK